MKKLYNALVKTHEVRTPSGYGAESIPLSEKIKKGAVWTLLVIGTIGFLYVLKKSN